MRFAQAVFVAAALLALVAQTDPFEGNQPGAARQIGGIRFCWAPAGSFRMGSPPEEPERRDDEGPVDVTITHGFWMGKYEVTQGEWAAVMGAFPREQDKGRGPDLPVYWVSWLEADEFCRRLTTRARESRTLPDGWEVRLPTEAQWEYACRAGTSTATAFGNRLDKTRANIATPYPGGGTGKPEGESVKVGTYPANAWGLHDMHGNVWEWCRDWYYRRLPGGKDPDLSTDPGERNRDGTYSRVRRGGAWIEYGWANRSAMRLRYEPERRSDHIGFRVAVVRR
jgi:formylglycine-generating enzyme required for sulfatase activity